jgi:hypothetical protein
MTSKLEFLAALEEELKTRGKPFSRQDAMAFVEACWPLIEETPDPAHWAGEFSAAAAAAGEVGGAG